MLQMSQGATTETVQHPSFVVQILDFGLLLSTVAAACTVASWHTDEDAVCLSPKYLETHSANQNFYFLGHIAHPFPPLSILTDISRCLT